MGAVVLLMYMNMYKEGGRLPPEKEILHKKGN